MISNDANCSVETPEQLQTAGGRSTALDAAKGLGMLLVIWAHIHDTGRLCTIIYSFHMPLFFVVSGYLFNSTKYPTFKSFLKKRIKTLIIPYLFLSFITLLYFVLVNKVYWNGVSGFWDSDNFKYLLQIFISQGSHNTRFNTPLWFVLCLFAVEVLYYFINRIEDNIIKTGVVTLLVAFGWYMESSYSFFDSSILPWSLDSALFALGFYAIGNILQQRFKNTAAAVDKHKYRFVILSAITVLSFAILTPLALLNGQISLGSKRLNNGLLLYITGLLGTLGIVSFGGIISRFRLIRYIGQNSFYVMATHWPPFFAYPILWSKVEKETGLRYFNKDSALECIFPFVFTCILCILLVATINYCKKRIGRKEKNNGKTLGNT